MARSTPNARRKSPSERERSELRKRVGAYVRQRREQLGLSQGDIIRELGYVSRNSVSNVETGREGLPAKRVYAWADVLRVPRDAFFRFVTGETKRVDADDAPDDEAKSATATNGADLDVLHAFRKLPAKYQKKIRDQIRELAALARTEK